MGVSVSRRSRTARVVLLSEEGGASNMHVHVRFAADPPDTRGACSPHAPSCWVEQRAGVGADASRQTTRVPWPRGPPCAVSSSDDDSDVVGRGAGALPHVPESKPAAAAVGVQGGQVAHPADAGGGSDSVLGQVTAQQRRPRTASSSGGSSGWPAGPRCDLTRTTVAAAAEASEDGEEGDGGRGEGGKSSTQAAERKRQLSLELYNRRCSSTSEAAAARAAGAVPLSPQHPWWHPELGPKPLRSTHSLMSALSTPPRCLPAPTSPAAPALPGVHSVRSSIVKAGMAWVMNAAPSRPRRPPRRFVF